MEACAARREGELTAHESSRAERALLVVVVVVDDGGGSAVVGEEVIAMDVNVVRLPMLSVCRGWRRRHNYD